MGAQVAQRDGIRGHAGDAETRHIAGRGIVDVEPPLGVEQGQGEGGEGLAETAHAEDGVRVRAAAVRRVDEAGIESVKKAVRSGDGGAQAGQRAFVKTLQEKAGQRFKVFHTTNLFWKNGDRSDNSEFSSE